MSDRKSTGVAAARLLTALAGACALFAIFAAGAIAAPFAVTGFDGEAIRNPAGDPAVQAGSHPYEVTTGVHFSVDKSSEGIEGPAQNVRDIEAELPAGLVGDPSATPRCPVAYFQRTHECPEDTQVGTVTILANEVESTYAVWNLTPPPGKAALFGFLVLLDPITARFSVRPAEPGGGSESYGLDLHIENISQALPLTYTSITFWGNPSDPLHDEERGLCLLNSQIGETPPPGGCPYRSVPKPFISLPTSCTGIPAVTRLRAVAWNGEADTAAFATHDRGGAPVATEGCDKVPFSGRVQTELDTAAADSPSGLGFDLEIPQSSNPSGLATAHLRDTTVTLPAGVSINPAAANGLVGCSVPQFDQFSTAPSQCPPASKVGTVEIDTRLLEEPLRGDVFVARQSENPFGSLLAVYLVAEGSGVRIKLPGKIELDPVTGRVVARFDDAPQTPFERLHLELFGGPRGALATPVVCGSPASETVLAPWSGAAAAGSSSALAIGSGPNGSACPGSAASRPFAPSLIAGSASNAAGAHSPLTVELDRTDGSQEPAGIEARLPEGLLATLKGVPECGDAQAAAGSCGAASRIGTVTVGAGAGPDPFYVRDGRAYLTGPYKGAPLGLDFVVPAVAGPLDLGTVNVRAAVFVDPVTAQVTVKTDELPHILDGIPLRLRTVRLDADRDGFTLNPTSCEPTAVAVRATSVEGAAADLADRYQAAGCRGLGFKPTLTTKLLGGRKAHNRRRHPALRVTVEEPAGDANLGRVSVAMPKSVLLDQNHIKTVCTRVQFAAGQCPEGSVYGFASVTTPLLDAPLSGPVYLRSSSNRLPDLVIDLHGQIGIVLDGRIESRHGGIRTVFEAVPDAPISTFTLDLKGGAKGLLVNSVDLCKAKARAVVRMVGQNGAIHDTRPTLADGCGRKKRR